MVTVSLFGIDNAKTWETLIDTLGPIFVLKQPYLPPPLPWHHPIHSLPSVQRPYFRLYGARNGIIHGIPAQVLSTRYWGRGGEMGWGRVEPWRFGGSPSPGFVYGREGCMVGFVAGRGVGWMKRNWGRSGTGYGATRASGWSFKGNRFEISVYMFRRGVLDMYVTFVIPPYRTRSCDSPLHILYSHILMVIRVEIARLPSQRIT
jgi:hypothetical protein